MFNKRGHPLWVSLLLSSRESHLPTTAPQCLSTSCCVLSWKPYLQPYPTWRGCPCVWALLALRSSSLSSTRPEKPQRASSRSRGWEAEGQPDCVCQDPQSCSSHETKEHQEFTQLLVVKHNYLFVERYLYHHFKDWHVKFSAASCPWSLLGNIQDRESNILVGIQTCHTQWQAIMILMRAEDFNSIKNLLELTVEMWTGPWWIILLGLSAAVFVDIDHNQTWKADAQTCSNRAGCLDSNQWRGEHTICTETMDLLLGRGCLIKMASIWEDWRYCWGLPLLFFFVIFKVFRQSQGVFGRLLWFFPETLGLACQIIVWMSGVFSFCFSNRILKTFHSVSLWAYLPVTANSNFIQQYTAPFLTDTINNKN